MRERPMRIAYFDCFSGASGDMILAACVDAGLNVLKAAKEKDFYQNALY